MRKKLHAPARRGSFLSVPHGLLIFSAVLVLGPALYLCNAQTTILISGAVRDSLSTSTPIPNAVVYLIRNRLTDTTKSTGNFTLTGSPLFTMHNSDAAIDFKPIQFSHDAIRITLLEKMRVAINAYSLQGRLLHKEKGDWEAGTHIIQPQCPVPGIALFQIIIGSTSYSMRAVSTHEGTGLSQSQAVVSPENLPLLKRTTTPAFCDTILVSATGYDPRRFPVTSKVLSGLRIRCLKTTVNPIPGDSVVDINGNVYRTVKIGTQTWMTENLKTTKYNDSVEIPLVVDGTEWQSLTTPAYCWYDNDINKGKTYGAFYNWYVVDPSNTHKLAPTGWHIATESDWATLETSLGGWSVAGGKLKETGTAHWISPNTGATNESGFTALPGGKRFEWFDAINGVTVPGVFLDMGYVGWWWTSTATACRNISENDVAIYHSGVSAFFGASVRCVKDN